MREGKLFKYLPWLLSVFLFLFVFRTWFLPRLIFGGDFTFPPFTEALRNLSSFPFVWNSHKGISLGGNFVPTLWIDTYTQTLPAFLIQSGIPALIVQKLVFFFPFLALAFLSSLFLFKTLFPEKDKVRFLVPLIFGLNTYILMVVGGGQMGIGLAYALAPLVLVGFIRSSQTLRIKSQIVAGLLLSLQVFFDLRLALLTVGIAFLYCLFHLGPNLKKYLKVFVLPFFIVLGVHFYWLLPMLLVRRAALPTGYGEAGWVEFLSFANFSDSFSLLHPNWPENIFGKIYFMRPEFLVIPLLAFASLLFMSKLGRQTKKNLLFLALLGLIGTFLAKGSRPPWGSLYLRLFSDFPGMSAFRDPTKFYLLTAIAYSLLIPFTLGEMINKIKKKTAVKYLILGAFLVYWLFTIRPAYLGQLGGLFQIKDVPQEYQELKDFIVGQPDFFRTLWLPKRHFFAFYDNNHPAIESPELFSAEELAVMGVKYVIIPYDTEGDIFVEDRKYDPEKRLALEKELDQLPWLKKVKLADKIAVYETPESQDHFFLEDNNGARVKHRMVNPTKYQVEIQGAKEPISLIFSETYDELWRARVGEKTIPSMEYIYRQADNEGMYNSLNSFFVNQTGDFEIVVEYTAQRYLNYGLIVSLGTLALVFAGLVCDRKKQ